MAYSGGDQATPAASTGTTRGSAGTRPWYEPPPPPAVEDYGSREEYTAAWNEHQAGLPWWQQNRAPVPANYPNRDAYQAAVREWQATRTAESGEFGGLVGQVETALAEPFDVSGAQQVEVPDYNQLPGVTLPDHSRLPDVRGTDFANLTDVRRTDFGAAPGLAPTSYSNLQGVTTGKTPLVRNRGGLATRLEGMYGDYAGRYGDFERRVGNLDNRFRLAGPDDFAAQQNRMEGAVYDRAYNRLAPEYERQEQAILTDLTNRGLAPTSEAYQDLYGQFTDQRQRDLTDLSLASVMAGAQEHERLANLTARNRGQMFGEAGGMFGGAGALYGAGESNVRSIEALNQAEEAERQRMAQRQLALRSLQGREQQAAFDNSLAARRLYGSEGAQTFGEDMGWRQEQRATGGQRYMEDMGARQQLFGEGQADFANQMGWRAMRGNEMDRQFAQSGALRQQQIAEMLMQRREPLNNLLALMSGISPGGLPQMPGYSQYAIQAPDVLGAISSNYAARASRPSGVGGFLSGLGSLAGLIF